MPVLGRRWATLERPLSPALFHFAHFFKSERVFQENSTARRNFAYQRLCLAPASLDLDRWLHQPNHEGDPDHRADHDRERKHYGRLFADYGLNSDIARGQKSAN